VNTRAHLFAANALMFYYPREFLKFHGMELLLALKIIKKKESKNG